MARLGLRRGFPLPFRQRESVFLFCISLFYNGRNEYSSFFQPIFFVKCPNIRAGAKNPPGITCLSVLTGALEAGRLCRTDFSREAVGRRCLPVCFFRARRRGNRCRHPLPDGTPRFREAETGQSGKCKHLDCPPFSRNSFLTFFHVTHGMFRLLLPQIYGDGLACRSSAVPAKKISTLQVVFQDAVFTGNLHCCHSLRLGEVASKGETYRARQATE